MHNEIGMVRDQETRKKREINKIEQRMSGKQNIIEIPKANEKYYCTNDSKRADKPISLI